MVRTGRPKNPESEAKFRKRIAEIGGTIEGEYINAKTKIKCMCQSGHVCNIVPTSINRGNGMCKKCQII